MTNNNLSLNTWLTKIPRYQRIEIKREEILLKNSRVHDRTVEMEGKWAMVCQVFMRNKDKERKKTAKKGLERLKREH